MLFRSYSVNEENQIETSSILELSTSAELEAMAETMSPSSSKKDEVQPSEENNLEVVEEVSIIMKEPDRVQTESVVGKEGKAALDALETSVDNDALYIEQESEYEIKEGGAATRQYVTVTIPAGSGATTVCNVLERNGIIDNANNFKVYIYTQKKERLLRHGIVTFPIDGTYEEILRILVN